MQPGLQRMVLRLEELVQRIDGKFSLRCAAPPAPCEMVLPCLICCVVARMFSRSSFPPSGQKYQVVQSSVIHGAVVSQTVSCFMHVVPVPVC